MDRMQILLAVSLKELGVEIEEENYQLICDMVYLAEKNGIHINPATVEFSLVSGHAFSPKIKKFNWGYPHSLYGDIKEISDYLKIEKVLIEKYGDKNTLNRYKLDDESKQKLDGLKSEIERKGLERCLREAAGLEKKAA